MLIQTKIATAIASGIRSQSQPIFLSDRKSEYGAVLARLDVELSGVVVDVGRGVVALDQDGVLVRMGDALDRIDGVVDLAAFVGGELGEQGVMRHLKQGMGTTASCAEVTADW
jgi:hypothetical protein